ncbi:hypothetical protein BOO31_05040 [Vibrio navarrensis]|nr:hypothetical protein [Vibrio navarrensis]
MLAPGQTPAPGEVVIDTLDESEVPTVRVATENGSNDITDDVQQIFAALEDGQDPTQLGDEFATAAGETGGSSLVSAGTIFRDGSETLASTAFTTQGLQDLGLNQAQSLSLFDVYSSLSSDAVTISPAETLPLLTVTLDVDSGSEADDFLTNNGSFTVSGQNDGATVEYFVDGEWTTTVPTPVEGENTIIVRQTDAAGNTSASSTLTFTLDTTSPDAPQISLDTDSGSLADDFLTNKGDFTVAGTEEGATVEYFVNGEWTTTAPTPVEGQNTIIVRQTDIAGNTSGSNTLTFTLDTTAPDAPQISLDTDSGSLADDFLTNKGDFTVAGTEDGGTVEYFVNGEWTTTAPIPVEGENTIIVRQTDAAGNTSGSSTLTFTLDTTAPDAPQISLDTDSGSLADDFLTNKGDFTVAGTEEGATVEYFVNSEWTTTAPTPVEGDNTIIVRQIDAAGNTSGSSTLSFTLDTTAPDAPQISLDTDSGSLADDFLTNKGDFTVTGTEEGATVEYFVNGEWITTAPTPVEGENTIVVRQTDAAGNTSGSSTLTFTLDTTAPDAPQISIDTDSGSFADDFLTNKGDFTVAGTEDGATVEYFVNGEWTTTAPTPVEGDNTIIVRQTDAAGNISGSSTLTFTLDTTAQAGTVSVDPITSDDVITETEKNQTITVTGSATGGDIKTGDIVTAIINGNEYKGSVSEDGSWGLSVSGSDLAVDTAFEVTVNSTDAAGNEVTSKGESVHRFDDTPINVNIDIDPITSDSVINAQEVNSLVTVTGTVTGESFSSGVVTLTINGVEYTGDVVDGKYSIEVKGSDLSADSDNVVDAKVDVVNTAGNIGSATSTEFYLVDTFARGTIKIDPITDDNVINKAESEGLVKVTGSVGGDARPGDQVTVVVNGVTYTTSVLSNKTWEVSVSGSDLAQDDKVTATVTGDDWAGNPFSGVSVKTYTEDTTAGTISINAVTGDNQVDDSEDNSVTLSGSTTGIEAGQTVSVSVVDASGTEVYSNTATVQADGSWSISGVDMSGFADEANYTVKADVSDAAGNAATQATQAFTTEDTTAGTISINAVTGDNQVDDSEDNSVTLSGSTTGIEAGQTVSVSVVDASGTEVYSNTATVQADGSWSISGVDMSGFADEANYTVKADVSDAAGNAATQATQAFTTEDTTAPDQGDGKNSIAFNDGDGYVNEDELRDVKLTATVEANGVAGDITLSQGTKEFILKAGEYSIDAKGNVTLNSGEALNLSAAGFTDGTLTVTLDVTDPAGNAGSVNDTTLLDTQVSAGIDINLVTGDGIVNYAETQVEQKVTGFVTGSDVKVGDEVCIYRAEGDVKILLGKTTVLDGFIFELSIDGKDLVMDNPATLYATLEVSDLAGNTGIVDSTERYFVFDDLPVKPSITNIKDESLASDYSEVTLYGKGGFDPNNGKPYTVEIFAKDSDGSYVSIGEVPVDSEGNWTLDISNIDIIPANDNEFFYAVQKDQYGNVSEPSNVVHYYHGNYNPALSEATDDFVLLGTGDDLLIVDQDDANNMLVADGGAGSDTAQFNFASTDASLVLNADGSVTITEINGDVNTFIEFENFKFTDVTKSFPELFAPTVTLERDGDDIINSDRTTVGYTINLPVGAVVGATLLLVIEGNETSKVLTQEDINAGSITGSILTSAINGNELSISAEIRYPNQPDNLEFKDNDSLNVNTLPDAKNDIISTDEGHGVTIDVLANDTDAENETLSISSASVIEGKGTVSIVDGKLYFEPVDDDFSGKVEIEYVVTDPQKGTSTAVVEVTVNPVADRPDLSLEAPQVTLPSHAFDVYKWDGVVIAPKYGNGNGVSGSELIKVIATLDKKNATPSTMVNAQDSSSYATAANEAVLLTGLVYLEAGVPYDFVGKGDDSLAITIGGQLVDEGRWGTGATLTGDAFAPTESGYYPISIYHHNQNGQGNFDVNVSINGASEVDLSSSNLSIVSDINSLTSSGIRTSGAQVDKNGVEFYDIYQVNEGRQDTAIPLSEIKASLNDNDGSETLSIALTGIPNGATISDGTNSVTITDNQSVDVTNWSLNSLVVTPPAGSHEDFTIKVTATSTEKANNHQAESTVDIHVIVHEQSPTVTQSDFVSGNEDQLISGNVLTNDSDADDVLSVVSISVNGQAYSVGNAIELTEGKLTVNSNGSFTFEPTDHWSGNVPDIQYTTNTGKTDTLTIEVKAVADAPNVTAVFGDTSTRNVTLDSALHTKLVNGDSALSEADKAALGVTRVVVEVNRNAMGTSSSEVLFGSDQADTMYGRYGNDVFVGGAGDDKIDGDDSVSTTDRDGVDTVIYSGPLSNYTLVNNGDFGGNVEQWAVFDSTGRDASARSGTGWEQTGDHLYEIERLIFADAIVELNKDGTYTVIQEKETEFNLSATLADRDGSEYLDEVQIKGLPDGATIVDKDTGKLLGGFQVINGEQVWVINLEGNSTQSINYDNLVVRYPSTETLDVDVTVVAKESSLPSDAGASTSVNVAASNDVLADQGGEVPTTLISLVIDSSGSMADKPSNTLRDMRIEYVLRAAVEMLEHVQSQNGSEDVLVQLVDFDTNAKSYGWITISEAVDKIEDALDGLDKKHYDGIFEPSGWTDYDDAAEATMDGYESNTIKSLQGSTNDVIYFLSDGQNTENWTNSTNTDWDKFIVDKEVIAVGIGDENRVPLDGLKEIAGADGTIVYIPDSKLLTELPKLRPTIGIAGSLLMAISGADEAKEVVIDATKAYVIQTIDTESSVTNMPANLVFRVDDVGNELVVETQYGDFRIGQDGSYFFQPVVGAPVIESGKSVAFEVLITVKDENNIESEQLVTLNVSPNGEANIAATSSFNASTGDDQIRGTDDNDIILGHAGNDVLDGGLGDDVLYGGSGNDILIGGLGNDILTGGEGADIFKWVDMETASDRVTDFSVAQGDKLDFSDLFEDMTQDDVSALLSSLADGSGEGGQYKVDVTDVNGDAHLTIVKGGHTLTIDFDGALAADITRSLMDNLNHLKD